jgi:hypothetical protein
VPFSRVRIRHDALVRRSPVSIAGLAFAVLLWGCGSDTHRGAGGENSGTPSAGEAALPPLNSGPKDDQTLASGLVLLRIEGCIPGDLSQSTDGMRARQLSTDHYRVYFLRLKDGSTEQGGYDETRWAAYDIDLAAARALRGSGGLAGVRADPSSPLFDELKASDCVSGVANPY